jgi:hypothetical protein
MTETPDRRLVVRVHNIWKKAAGDVMPRRSQIDPREFGADWANCILIDLDPVPGRSRFSHVGENLRDPTWPTFDRQCVSECLEGSLLELVTRHISKLTTKRKPISLAGSAVHDEADILYRTTLLPLSETGDKIDGVLAAVAYREVTVAQELLLVETLPEPGAKAPLLRHARGAKVDADDRR